MISNVTKTKTKRFLLKIGKILLIILAILLALIIIGLIIGNLSGKDSESVNDTLISSRSAALSEELQEAWSKTPSDIDGMTKLDKYNAGLSVADGSDSDGDGLRDKEEIEVYHSDPLKVSTAGDLYSDLYKVENGLNVSSAYEYMGDRQFSHNSCPEVSLSAENPLDFNAVVAELSGIQRISGLQVYSAYQVYNYSGKFSVDLTEVLRRENIELSDVAVYVSDGNSLERYAYTDEGNTIILKDKFSSASTYQVYCTEKNFIRFAAAKLGADSALDTISAIVDLEEDPEEVTGSGLVIISPLLVEFNLSPMIIYHEKLGTETDTQILKDKITTHILDYFGVDNKYRMEYKESNAIEIELTYNLLKSAISFMDITNLSHSEINSWKYIFFIYYDYEGKLEFERQASMEVVSPDPDGMGNIVDSEGNIIRPSTADPVTGFDLVTDTLPFGNFKTGYSTDGSCAGISHLTAYLYNQKMFPTRSSAAFFDANITWNLGNDEENYTLCDLGLGDFKDENFVLEHSSDGQTLDTGLTTGEMEFAKMIASAYKAGNRNAEFIFYELFGGNNVVQDYAVIESAIAYLESGKILDVYLDMVDGTRHTVNLIGYKKDSVNPYVTWFSVYDCNFPGNRTNDEPLSDAGFQLRVEKKLCASGNGYTFSFDYFPLQDRSYGASSNPDISENNLIIILDEFGHLLND